MACLFIFLYLYIFFHSNPPDKIQVMNISFFTLREQNTDMPSSFLKPGKLSMLIRKANLLAARRDKKFRFLLNGKIYQHVS